MVVLSLFQSISCSFHRIFFFIFFFIFSPNEPRKIPSKSGLNFFLCLLISSVSSLSSRTLCRIYIYIWLVMGSYLTSLLYPFTD